MGRVVVTADAVRLLGSGPARLARAVTDGAAAITGAAGPVSPGAASPAAALVCAGLALLLWPAAPRPVRPGRRSRGGRATGRGAAVWGAAGRSAPLGVIAGAALLVGMLWSPAGAIVVGLLGGAVTVLLRWAAADRRGRKDLVELAAALRSVARELRAGAAPESAITAILGSASAPSARFTGRRARRSGGPMTTTERTLRGLMLPEPAPRSPAAPHTRRTGRRPPVGPGRGGRPDPVDELTVRLVGGWRLAMRSGLPLTRLVDAVVAVADERVASLDARRAEVAGPRLSGWVLAGLPAMGLLLGSGMGVDPVAVLLAPHGLGPVLLVAGTGLTVAGLLWSARIVRR